MLFSHHLCIDAGSFSIKNWVWIIIWVIPIKISASGMSFLLSPSVSVPAISTSQSTPMEDNSEDLSSSSLVMAASWATLPEFFAKQVLVHDGAPVIFLRDVKGLYSVDFLVAVDVEALAGAFLAAPVAVCAFLCPQAPCLLPMWL